MRLSRLAVIAAVIGLVACGCNKNQHSFTSALSEDENLVISVLDQKGYCEHARPIIVNSAKRVRLSNGSRSHPKYELPKKDGFCDLVGAFNVATRTSCGKASLSKGISDAYFQVYGADYATRCSLKMATLGKDGRSEVVVEEVPETMKKDIDTFVEDAKVVQVLTLDKYDDLIEAVGSCARAKQQTMSFTSAGKALTVQDYDAVMITVHQCKMYELEKALQEK